MNTATPYTHPSRFPEHWSDVFRRTGIQTRPGDGHDTVLFVHGLGCSAQFFELAPHAEALDGVTLARFDFNGHGDADLVDIEGDVMEALADQLGGVWLQLHATGYLHIVSHSMGTVPALILHSRLRESGLPFLGRFISIEGNLTAGDCSLASRSIATTLDIRGIDEFGWKLHASTDRAEHLWGRELAWCDPAFLKQTASSLVDWCDSGRAADLWRTIEHPVYLYGERTGYPEHNRELLETAHVAAISGSGHFPMIDNGPELWAVVGDAIKELHENDDHESR